MARRLTLDRLLAVCDGVPEPARAVEAVEALGWLSPWWLRPEVIDAAWQEQPVYAAYRRHPALPCQPGGCWALLVNPRRLELLRDAFVLPLLWREGDGDDPCLPGPLRDLAGQVRQQLGEGFAGWGLTLPKPCDEEGIDLSPLDDGAFGASSAWASLAGGLLLAREGLTPDTTVWASAAWDEAYGIGRVEGLQAKLDHAAERGAKHVFVPAQNQPEGGAWAAAHSGQPEVSLLVPAPSAGKLSPSRLLGPYLSELGLEPGPEQPDELKKRYYLLVTREKARDFHWRVLMKSAAEACARSLPEDCKPTHAVTVVSLEPSAVALAPASLPAQVCLLLYTQTDPPDARIARTLDQVQRELEKRGVKCVPGPICAGRRDDEVRQVAELLHDFADGTPPERLAFDLTPGYKSLTLAVLEAAPVGSWLLYCRHEQAGADNRVVPGTERYDCWRK
jgi:hypothetical protein